MTKPTTILNFQEHDLSISGSEDTIREFARTIRGLQKESCSDIPNTINDIVYSMEVEIKALNNMDEDDWDI